MWVNNWEESLRILQFLFCIICKIFDPRTIIKKLTFASSCLIFYCNEQWRLVAQNLGRAAGLKQKLSGIWCHN